MRAGIFVSGALSLSLALAGCSSTGQQAASVEALPYWTNQSQFNDAEGREVFVGIGQGRSSAEAIENAKIDAQAGFARSVGGQIVVSDRVREHSGTNSVGVSVNKIEAERFVGVASVATIYGSDLEHVVRQGPDGMTAYVRLSVPREVLRTAQEEVKREHEQRIMRQIEARRLAGESRLGDVDGRAFAYVAEEAEHTRRGGESRAATERRAKDQSRHAARTRLVRQLHGAQVRIFDAEAGTRLSTSFTAASGVLHSEVVSELVWWIGDTAVARTYMLGWIDKE